MLPCVSKMTGRGMLFALPCRMSHNSHLHRIEVMEEQVSGLHTELRDFKAEMTEFKADMTEFKAETSPASSMPS